MSNASPQTYAPTNTPLQLKAAKTKQHPPVPKTCVVTGGTGFVGLRLVEMLIERGAQKVISFDIVPPPPNAWNHPSIEWRIGDITDKKAVEDVVQNADCVWHNAAAVGPFHPKPLYYQVNHQGTLNVIDACRSAGVPKVVMSSSPSTRFTGADVDGLTEDQLPPLPLESYLQTYAETKASAEMAMRAACSPTLRTVAVAPHQVYGPRDNLFLPNLLETAGTGRLRVFGGGMNRNCWTHVDNYCHGLIIAERTLEAGSSTLGKFYIVTDGDTHPDGNQYLYFWKVLDEAVVAMGFKSLWKKAHYPEAFLYFFAYVCKLLGCLTGVTFKLNWFNVRVLTMHRWFDISAAEKDLGYKPIIGFREGWDETIEVFKEVWLPGFQKNKKRFGWGKISDGTQAKIDLQAKEVKKKQ